MTTTDTPAGHTPPCACPVIASFVRHLWSGEVSILEALAGTKSTPEVEERRAYMCADFAVRVADRYAGECESLPDMVDQVKAMPADEVAVWAAEVVGEASRVVSKAGETAKVAEVGSLFLKLVLDMVAVAPLGSVECEVGEDEMASGPDAAAG